MRIRYWRWSWWLPLVLFACAAQAARSDWREMSVGRLRLYSAVSDSKTREIARRLQAFESTVGELLRHDDPLPDIPTDIYVLHGRDFNQFAAPYQGLAGFFQARAYGNVIAINGDLDFDNVRESIYHEYTHYIQNSSSTVNFPPWYAEGYAELFSSFRMKDDTIYIGETPAGVRFNLAQWIPLERLLSVSQSDPEYHTEQLAPQFYGESWILVHMLLFDDTTYTPATGHYLDNMNLGVPEAEAFASSFEISKAELDKRLQELIRKGRIHIKRLVLAQSVALTAAATTPMPVASADAQLARLAFYMRRPRTVVLQALEQAMKSGGSEAATRALQARILAHAGQSIEIADLVASLGKGGVDEVQQRLDVADALLTRSDVEQPGVKVCAILNDLIESPDAPLEAVGLWSDAAASVGVDAARIRKVLEGASRRAPHNTRLLAHLAEALASSDDLAGAKAAYIRIIQVSHSPEERLWAQKQADSERLRSR